MAVLSIIAAIVSIAVGVIAGGQQAYSIVNDLNNKSIRSAVYKVSNDIRKEIDAKRLDANKLIALFQQRNSDALYGLAVQNPLLSRTLKDIQTDSARLASKSAELNSLEVEIQNLVNQMGSLGYAQTHSASREEKSRLQDAKKELENKRDKYEALRQDLANYKPTNSSAIGNGDSLVSDLDAKTQNIIGGLKSNA